MQSPAVLSTVLALSSAFLFFLAGFSFSRRRTRGALELAGLIAASAIYTLGYALELTRTDLGGMLAALRLEYLGIAFICYFWVVFACRFSGLVSLSPFARTLLALPSLAVVLLFWTDPLHHLFYARSWVRTDAPFPLIGAEPGPAYWAHVAVSQIEIVAGIVLLIAYALRADPRHRRQAQAVALASLFPWASFLIYLLGASPWGLDVTPVGTIVSGAVVAWALFRLGILDLVPAARELAIDALQDGFLVLDDRGVIADANDAAHALLRGARLRIGEIPTPDHGDTSWLVVLRRLVESGEGRLDLRIPGNGRPERRLAVQCIQVRAAEGLPAGAVLVIRDVSETAALLDKLTEMADTDELTGLYNRRRFFEIGGRAISVARRKSRSLAVAVLDLDHFKHVNDRFGHDAGDVVLREVAVRLRGMLRTGDIICRYGGEELAVLMPDTDACGAATAAERFRQAVSEAPFEWNHLSIGVSTSVGLFAGVPAPADALEQFLSRADVALYRAKASGRNRCATWRQDDAPHLDSGPGT